MTNCCFRAFWLCPLASLSILSTAPLWNRTPWKCHLCCTSAYFTALTSNEAPAGSEFHHVCWLKSRTDMQLWDQIGKKWSSKALTQLLCYPSSPVKALLFVLLLFSLYWISTSPFDAVTYYLPNTWACTCMCQWVWRRARKFLFRHLIVQSLIAGVRFVGVFRICAVEVKHLSDVAILSRSSSNGCDIDY